MIGETDKAKERVKEAADMQTDDQARRDGGKTTEDKPVSEKQMKQIEEKALDHTKDEPGS